MIGASTSARTLRCRAALEAARRVIGATPCRAAAVLVLAAPATALASGNGLSLTGATYDTTTPEFGSGALSGGYGLTPAGACYGTAAVSASPGGATTFTKTVWIKAPTALPSSPQLIFGDPAGYIAEAENGYLVFGSGSNFAAEPALVPGPNNAQITNPAFVNDGNWHLVSLVVQSYPSPFSSGLVSITGSIDGIEQAGAEANNTMFSSLSSAQSLVTGVRGNPNMTAYNGTTLSNFAGEVDEAACFSGPLPNAQSGRSAYVGTENWLVGLWPLDGSGADASSWVYQPPLVPASTNPPPPPSNASPSGGFPLQP